MNALSEKISSILSVLESQSSEYQSFAEQLLRHLPDYMLSVDDAFLQQLIQQQWILMTKKRHKPIIKIEQIYSCVSPEMRVSSIRLIVNDMPFLINSLMNVFSERRLSVKAVLHSVISAGTVPMQKKDQAIIWVELDPVLTKADSVGLKETILRVLSDVHCSVKDWQKMKNRMNSAIHTWNTHPAFRQGDQTSVEEFKKFMAWIIEYFTFMGVRYYKKVCDEHESHSLYEQGSNLGVLTSVARHPKKIWLEKCNTHFPGSEGLSQLFYFTKTNTFSTVHRMAYTDLLVLRRCNKDGEIVGEERFVGLLTSDAYDSDPTKIPFVRLKIQALIERLASPSRHLNKQTLFLIKRFPRLDLLQASFEELYPMIMKTVSAQNRQEVCSFIRVDVFKRFYSCLIFVPRDLYNTKVRLEIERVLLQSLNGDECYSNTHFAEMHMAQLHVIIKVNPTAVVDYNVQEIERKILEVCISWQDQFKLKLRNLFSQEQANYLHQCYQDFPTSYTSLYTPVQGTHDIISIERLCDQVPLAIDIHADEESRVSIKLYEYKKHRVSLSQIVPILGNMGMRLISEHFVDWKSSHKGQVFISHFHAELHEKTEFSLPDLQSIFYEALEGILKGEFANDPLNRLIFKAKLAAEDLELLRAYIAYLQQVNFQISSPIAMDILCRHFRITQLILRFFHLKFAPGKRQQRQLSKCKNQLANELSKVSNVYDDRLLTSVIALIENTVRTNFYFDEKKALVLKISTRNLAFAPKPKPLFDAFIYSQTCEGIYLRMSRVARGGIRWSFRVLDYRTEVMSLMRAQDVKNSLIVPSGAKGGFVAKNMSDQDPIELKRKKGEQAYSVFISSILQITDNLIQGHIHRPPYLVAYDDDDPYMVVAADKGTATFSDLANSIAAEHQFWMKDAFASGGSNGYDHKKMAVTANSAWVSVDWHMYEMNMKQSYLTAVGIGDMSGDVFGNGLLKENIKLIAAFNHNHIFIDPSPDPEKSYRERNRLFRKKYSQWSDYDSNAISTGGGVYSRQVKFIRLSRQAQKALGIREKQLRPSQLIRAILCAPVDLLWNGGIGTYVRSSNERDSEIGDRQNDACRVAASDMRVKIVGEGGNLGFTQLARIEFSKLGGKINTDFIDNSGGVDCSDHEVNLKILYQTKEETSGQALNHEIRNRELKKYAPEIVSLILGNTLAQNIAISVAVDSSRIHWELFHRLITHEQKNNGLDRTFEALPSRDEMKDRIAHGGPSLLRPEVAFLLCFIKNKLQEQLVGSVWLESLPVGFLTEMFPHSMRKDWLQCMLSHPLKRELLATRLSNVCINEAGLEFIQLMQEEFMIEAQSVVRAFVLVRKWFNISEMLAILDTSKTIISSKLNLECRNAISTLLRRATRWCLKNDDDMNVYEKIDSIDLQTMYARISDLLTEKQRKKHTRMKRMLTSAGIQDNHAHQLSVIRYVHVYLNIIDCSFIPNTSFLDLVNVYNYLAAHLKINQLRESLFSLHSFDKWNAVHRSSIDAALDQNIRRFCREVLHHRTQKTPISVAFNEWCSRCASALTEWQKLFTEEFNPNNMSFYSVAVMLLSSIRDPSVQPTQKE